VVYVTTFVGRLEGSRRVPLALATLAYDQDFSAFGMGRLDFDNWYQGLAIAAPCISRGCWGWSSRGPGGGPEYRVGRGLAHERRQIRIPLKHRNIIRRLAFDDFHLAELYVVLVTVIRKNPKFDKTRVRGRQSDCLFAEFVAQGDLP